MTYRELAAKLGITIEALARERMTYLQAEGYDDEGREYDTLESWVKRQAGNSYEPIDGGRGVGELGRG